VNNTAQMTFRLISGPNTKTNSNPNPNPNRIRRRNMGLGKMGEQRTDINWTAAAT